MTNSGDEAGGIYLLRWKSGNSVWNCFAPFHLLGSCIKYIISYIYDLWRCYQFLAIIFSLSCPMIYQSIFCYGYSCHNFKPFQDFQGFSPAQLSVKSNHGKKIKWCQEAKKGVHLGGKLTIWQIIQDLEGFSRDLGFVRDSGKPRGWGGGGGTPLQEANRDVPLGGIAFSRLEWLWRGRIFNRFTRMGSQIFGFLG